MTHATGAVCATDAIVVATLPSSRFASAAVLASWLALVSGCVIGPKQDDPLKPGDADSLSDDSGSDTIGGVDGSTGSDASGAYDSTGPTPLDPCGEAGVDGALDALNDAARDAGDGGGCTSADAGDAGGDATDAETGHRDSESVDGDAVGGPG
jgi:hypothetical protein